MSQVQLIQIEPDDAEQRLDRWLRARFPQLSQGQIEKMCRKGQLRADGARVKGASRLSVGQVIRVPPIPEKNAPQRRSVLRAERAPPVPSDEAEAIRACVIYKDDDILVLNKPAGLPVQGGSKQTKHLDALTPALMFDSDTRPRLVHRLDKDTSGVLVMARTRIAAARLARAFASRQVRKIYWAVVRGCPSPRAGRIRYALVKSGGKDADNERMRCLHPDAVHTRVGRENALAKPAITDYITIETAAKRLSWLAMMPITGRRHQLRAHIAELGTPILGDGKYRGEDSSRKDFQDEKREPLHLHARALILEHPISGRRMEFAAPLPEHMAKTWAMMDWREDSETLDPFAELEDNPR